MKVAYIHDGKYIRSNGKVYTSNAVNKKLLDRYLEFFEKIIICGREEGGAKKIEGLNCIEGNNIDFKLNKLYKNPKQYFTQYSRVNDPIRDLVSEVDACIIKLPNVLGILAVKECIKQQKPYLIEVVGCCWDALWNYGSIQGKVLAPIMYLLNRKAIKNAPYVLYVSNEFLQTRYPTKGISVGCSDVKIKIEEDIIESRLKKIQEKELIKECVYIGLIGSLDVKYKGYDTAIRAVKELKNKGYNVKLRCLGGGGRSKWEQFASTLGVEQEIEFCGTLESGKPVLEWLDTIDIFIIPSLTEGLPRALVEAMSRGCLTIGSNVGGIKELLDSSMRIRPKCYKELAGKIELLIREKELAQHQSKQNFIKAQQYSEDKLEKVRKRFIKNFHDDCIKNYFKNEANR